MKKNEEGGGEGGGGRGKNEDQVPKVAPKKGIKRKAIIQPLTVCVNTSKPS